MDLQAGAAGTPVYAEMDVSAIVADNEQATQRRKKKAPPLHTQVAALVQSVAKQTSRTDQLLELLRPQALAQAATPVRVQSTEKVVTNLSNKPHRGGRRTRRVSGSCIKRRSPKNGRGSGYARASSSATYTDESVCRSSDSDIEAQVQTAMGMMEPKFRHYKGKQLSRDDYIKRNRPFFFLGREQQRNILRKGHPEELSFVQHISGLIAMALDIMDNSHEAYGIINHVGQLLDDSGFVNWETSRAFSNSVVLNVAKGKWSWCSERAIESCRTNFYMRARPCDDTAWSGVRTMILIQLAKLPSNMSARIVLRSAMITSILSVHVINARQLWEGLNTPGEALMKRGKLNMEGLHMGTDMRKPMKFQKTERALPPPSHRST